MSYTPGPWKSPWEDFEPESNEAHNRFTGPNGEEVCGVGYYDGPILIINRDNARLIAAAPELLEALKECVALLEHTGFDYRFGECAIAKATRTK